MAVAIDEFRCEAAVYSAGYPTGIGFTDADVAEDLFDLNLQLIRANDEYQAHLDVERLRHDVLKTVVFHVRYMSKVAARFLHEVPVDLASMNKFARENWEALIEPTWSQFLGIYQAVPSAFSPWTATASQATIDKLVGVVASLMTSFGYEATEDAFYVHLSVEEVQARFDRANAEADLLGHTP